MKNRESWGCKRTEALQLMDELGFCVKEEKKKDALKRAEERKLVVFTCH